MFPRHRLIMLAVAVLAVGIAPTRMAKAGVYTFSGTITSIDDPYSAFSSLAAIGAPVSGSFQYDAAASYPSPFQFNPYVTGYFNERSDRPLVTNMQLVINGFSQHSSPYSLTNLDVGNNVPSGTPFWPSGDFFRYFDQIDSPSFGHDVLVDYDKFGVDSYAVPFGNIILNDPSGAVFSSQDLPRGLLPLSAFSSKTGEFTFLDGNGDDINYGTIGFRIDAIQTVPEPGSFVLLATAVLPIAAVWLFRRRRRPSLSKPSVA